MFHPANLAKCVQTHWWFCMSFFAACFRSFLCCFDFSDKSESQSLPTDLFAACVIWLGLLDSVLDGHCDCFAVGHWSKGSVPLLAGDQSFGQRQKSFSLDQSWGHKGLFAWVSTCLDGCLVLWSHAPSNWLRCAHCNCWFLTPVVSQFASTLQTQCLCQDGNTIKNSVMLLHSGWCLKLVLFDLFAPFCLKFVAVAQASPQTDSVLDAVFLFWSSGHFPRNNDFFVLFVPILFWDSSEKVPCWWHCILSNFVCSDESTSMVNHVHHHVLSSEMVMKTGWLCHCLGDLGGLVLSSWAHCACCNFQFMDAAWICFENCIHAASTVSASVRKWTILGVLLCCHTMIDVWNWFCLISFCSLLFEFCGSCMSKFRHPTPQPFLF